MPDSCHPCLSIRFDPRLRQSTLRCLPYVYVRPSGSAFATAHGNSPFASDPRSRQATCSNSNGDEIPCADDGHGCLKSLFIRVTRTLTANSSKLLPLLCDSSLDECIPKRGADNISLKRPHPPTFCPLVRTMKKGCLKGVVQARRRANHENQRRRTPRGRLLQRAIYLEFSKDCLPFVRFKDAFISVDPKEGVGR